MLMGVARDHPKRTAHDTTTAADAALYFTEDIAVFVFIKAAGDAAIQTGGLVAVAAENRHFDSVCKLDVEPFLRRRELADRTQQGLLFRMLDRAGQFTAFATGAALRYHIDSGHVLPPDAVRFKL
jgi:hypothetical protein